jgi:hypothetical protein
MCHCEGWVTFPACGNLQLGEVHCIAEESGNLSIGTRFSHDLGYDRFWDLTAKQ